MNKNKIFITLLIVVVAIGTAFFFGMKKNSVPARIQITDQTASWKIYTNENIGVSFKYPPSYTIVEKDNNNIDLRTLQTSDVGPISLSVVKTPDTLDDWLSKNISIYGSLYIATKSEFAGRPAYYIRHNVKEIQIQEDSYAVKVKDHILTVRYVGPFNLDLYSGDQKETYRKYNDEYNKTEGLLIYQTFSSFKFLDASSEQRVVDLVKNLPDVKNWLAIFTGPGGTGPKSSGKPMFRIEGQNGEIYTVRAYEDVPSPEAHTATFNVFQVNVKTGKISKEF